MTFAAARHWKMAPVFHAVNPEGDDEELKSAAERRRQETTAAKRPRCAEDPATALSGQWRPG
jgi:hypothetical protein